MSTPPRTSSRPRSLRKLAETRVPRGTTVDLNSLTPGEIRELLHEMEVQKVELQIQNDQLRDSQQEAEEARDRYRELYESAPVGFLTLDASGAITEANRFVSRLLDAPPARLAGQKLSALVTARHQDRWHRARRRILSGGVTGLTLDLELVSAKGRTILVQLAGLAFGGDGIAPRGVRVAITDMTALRKSERDLRAAAAAVSMAEEGERRKLASDLHDDAGQILSLTALKLAALIEGSEPARAGPICEVADLVAHTRRRISSLSFQLSPPLLHDLGLVAALGWLREDLEQSYGLQVAIADRCELELDEVARVTFFRVVRELLFNVAKHAGVKAASVRIWSERRIACVAVEDAGVGLPPESSRHGFGLLALRERLEHLGGTLETRSTPGGGATVVATLPVPLETERKAP